MGRGATEFANTWMAQNVGNGDSLRRESREAKLLVTEIVNEANRSGFFGYPKSIESCPRSTLAMLNNLHRDVTQFFIELRPSAQGPPIVKTDLHRPPHCYPACDGQAFAQHAGPGADFVGEKGFNCS